MLGVRHMISFNGVERRIYARILSLGSPVSTARYVVALWIYLQFIGIDLLDYISDCRNDSVLARFVAEAESILQTILASAPPVVDLAIPFTAFMATEQLNLRFFLFNQEAIARGLAYIMNGIGRIIFNSESNCSVSPHCHTGAPNPVDLRTLFVTFPSSALTKKDILDFFSRRWGNIVEQVLIERTERGTVPVYGRIVLRDEFSVEVVFARRQVLVMKIGGGGPITVRKFSVD